MVSETETTTLSVITDVATNLPDPVKRSLFSALGLLLGDLKAIPAAWLHGRAQTIADTTAGRSLVAAELAKGVAEQAINDPILRQAATDIYLPTNIRRAANRVRVAQRTAERASEASTDGAKSATPDADWMNAFVRFAEDASSERLQDLFGRILAGEVVRPGSFSPATLRTIAELDQLIAQDFSLVWERSVGEAVDYSSDFHRGEWFSRWKRLAEVGLMAATITVQQVPEFRPSVNGNALWCPWDAGRTFLLIQFSQSCRARWEHIEFTRIGRQIGSILAPPYYETNMREAGRRLELPGVVRVELHKAGKLKEVLYQAPSS